MVETRQRKSETPSFLAAGALAFQIGASVALTSLVSSLPRIQGDKAGASYSPYSRAFDQSVQALLLDYNQLRESIFMREEPEEAVIDDSYMDRAYMAARNAPAIHLTDASRAAYNRVSSAAYALDIDYDEA